jgi:hypothetical protein
MSVRTRTNRLRLVIAERISSSLVIREQRAFRSSCVYLLGVEVFAAALEGLAAPRTMKRPALVTVVECVVIAPAAAVFGFQRVVAARETVHVVARIVPETAAH